MVHPTLITEYIDVRVSVYSWYHQCNIIYFNFCYCWKYGCCVVLVIFWLGIDDIASPRFLLYELWFFAHRFHFLLLSQLFVAVLITTQPFYLAGIDDVEKAQGSAYGATGMFLFTFLASIGGIWFDSMQKIEPVANGTEPEAEYHLSQDIPTSYGTSA